MAAFNVNIFGYRGLAQIPEVLPKQMKTDSVQVLVQPYEFRQQLIVPDAPGVIASNASVLDTPVLRIEVADNHTVYFEVNPPNREGGIVQASALSPSMSGKDILYFGKGWTISLMSADP